MNFSSSSDFFLSSFHRNRAILDFTGEAIGKPNVLKNFIKEMSQQSFHEQMDFKFKYWKKMIDEINFNNLNQENLEKKELFFVKTLRQMSKQITNHLCDLQYDWDEELWKLMIDNMNWFHKEQWKWTEISIGKTYHPNPEIRTFVNGFIKLRDLPLDKYIDLKQKEFWNRKQKRMDNILHMKPVIIEGRRRNQIPEIHFEVNTDPDKRI